MSYVLFAALPVLTTFLGGYVVYRWKRDLHPWLLFSGGLLLGVAFLHLLPEAFERAEGVVSTDHLFYAPLITIFALYLLDSVFGFHGHHDGEADHGHRECVGNDRHVSLRGFIRASGLIIHSFMDGLAIGGGFAVDPSLGVVVTIAVLLHDFADGMSLVSVLRQVMKGNTRAIRWALVCDAVAPVFGFFVGQWITPDTSSIALLLAGFSGLFLYLALVELLPQAHASGKMGRWGWLLTLAGIALTYIMHFAE